MPRSSALIVPKSQKIMAVLWSSFLVSSLASILFFFSFDPHTALHLDISKMAAYSIGFFLFWLTTGLSSLLTLYFSTPLPQVSSSTHIDEL